MISALLFSLFFSSSSHAQGNCVELFTYKIDETRGTPETLLALVNDGHPESIRWLLDNYKIDMNVVDDHGRSALIAAVWNRSPAVVSALLRYPQLLVQVRDLHFAFNYSNIFILDMLLKDPRTDVNGQDMYGNTLLHYAAKEQNQKVVERLVQDQRTNGLVLNKRGETAMDIARETQNAEIIRLLDVYNF